MAAFAPPVLVLGASAWGLLYADRIIHFLNPDAAWEQSLGWLNIRAQKQAARALRWLGYAIVVLLVDSLFGIYWALTGLAPVAEWADPAVLVDSLVRLAGLALCLAIWGIYLGYDLVPRLRAQREEAALKKHRAKLDAEEEERRIHSPRPRVKLPQTPRVNSPLPLPGSRRRWNMPGG